MEWKKQKKGCVLGHECGWMRKPQRRVVQKGTRNERRKTKEEEEEEEEEEEREEDGEEEKGGLMPSQRVEWVV